MTERFPASQEQLKEFYARIAQSLESVDGNQPHMAVARLNPLLYRNMRSEAEARFVKYGPSVSDRYLFGVCSAVVAMREENGGSLPDMTDGQYLLDKEVQDSHQAVQDALAIEYFNRLEVNFEDRFPMTRITLAAQEEDLKIRLKVSEFALDEGFVAGWYTAVKAVMPLFPEAGQADGGSQAEE